MTHPNVASKSFESEQWRSIISSGAREMGINVSAASMGKLVLFAQMLSEWNNRINLTAITEPREVAVKHFLDSMAALPYIPETGRLLDIGSGGGFPGLVLAIFRPSLSITSIDSVRKKISFQQHVIRTMGLTSAQALHTRAESLHGKTERYDIIVCRALGDIDMFTALSLPLLSEEGRAVAYKGVMEEGGEGEIEVFKAKHPEISVDIQGYLLPFSGDPRSLVFVRRS